jgi:hypothetical protein
MKRRSTAVAFQVPIAANLEEIFDDELDRHYAARFLDLLHRKMITWDFDRFRPGYIRLMHKYLANLIPVRRLKRIITRLREHGVISVHGSYCPGRNSKGYRLNPGYIECRPYRCTHKEIIRRIRQQQEETEARFLPVHRHLKKYLRRVEFDQVWANAIIPTMEPDNPDKVSVEEYRQILRECCKRLRDRRKSDIHVDKYGRVHTPITNLPKELRECLTIDGKPLVGLDIANSQPLFAGIVAMRYQESRQVRHRMETRDFNTRTTPYVAQEVKEMARRHEARQANVGVGDARDRSHKPGARQDSGDARSSCIMCCARGPNPMNTDLSVVDQVDIPPADLIEYLEVCQSGHLYEHLVSNGMDRDGVKREIFAAVYFGRLYRNELWTRFEAEFATVGRMLRRLKTPHYQHAARLMQSYESTMMIAIICARILAERPELPIITIHDSILTVPEGVEYIRQVMLEEFGKLGITPILRDPAL